MESLYFLLGTCMFIFIFYFLYEVVRLRKEVNTLHGIVNHLLKDHPEKNKIITFHALLFLDCLIIVCDKIIQTIKVSNKILSFPQVLIC